MLQSKKCIRGPRFRFPDVLDRTAEAVGVDKHNAELLEFGFSDTIDELDHNPTLYGSIGSRKGCLNLL